MHYRLQRNKLQNIIDPLQGDEHLAETKLPSIHAHHAAAQKTLITFDATIKQKAIAEGTVNEEKAACMDLLLYGAPGYSGSHWEKIKNDTTLILKFDSHDHMIQAVKKHNSNHPDTKIHPARYFKDNEGNYVSSRVFKLIDVPLHYEQEDIEKAIRTHTKRSGFHIRKRNNSTTVYVTFFSDDSAAIVKNFWAIPINGTLHRFMPAYFTRSHIRNCKRYTAKFTGFPLGISAHSFLNILEGLHGKNAYCTNALAEEILVEFELAVHMNLACTRSIWY